LRAWHLKRGQLRRDPPQGRQISEPHRRGKRDVDGARRAAGEDEEVEPVGSGPGGARGSAEGAPAGDEKRDDPDVDKQGQHRTRRERSGWQRQAQRRRGWERSAPLGERRWA
jgi:hypothetical protein